MNDCMVSGIFLHSFTEGLDCQPNQKRFQKSASIVNNILHILCAWVFLLPTAIGIH